VKLDNVSIHIGFVHCNSGEDEIRIEISDENSSVRFFEGTLSVEAFAGCAFGHRLAHFYRAEIRGLDLLGKYLESKHEFVPFDWGSRHSPDEEKRLKQEALKPFEVDGWKARRGDMDNHHNWVRSGEKGTGYNVVFFRHVDKMPESRKTSISRIKS
jgi:hypothetical protein